MLRWTGGRGRSQSRFRDVVKEDMKIVGVRAEEGRDDFLKA